MGLPYPEHCQAPTALPKCRVASRHQATLRGLHLAPDALLDYANALQRIQLENARRLRAFRKNRKKLLSS